MNLEQNTNLVPVLLTTSVMIYVDGDPTDLESGTQAQLDAAAETLRRATNAAFSNPPSEPIGAVAFHYPTTDDTNIGQCADCGTWLTDPDKLDAPDGLMHGHWHEQRFLCFEHYLMAIGEFPKCCFCCQIGERELDPSFPDHP